MNQTDTTHMAQGELQFAKNGETILGLLQSGRLIMGGNRHFPLKKDHDGNYCPENCTFITMAEQARNKTNNVLIKYNGEERCVVEWCEILNLKPKTVYKRIYDGHTDPNAILYQGDLRDLRKSMA